MTDPGSALHRLKLLRYDFLPRVHPRSPGFSGVQLVLCNPAADGEPNALTLPVVDRLGRRHVTNLRADTGADSTRCVAPGRIYLNSCHDLEAAFFSFGGVLEVACMPEQQLVTLRSDAPILELSWRQKTTATLLATEAEATLARLGARQRRSHLEAIEELCDADALALYLALLRALIVWCRDKSAWRRSYPDLVSLLEQERAWYTRSGIWSGDQPDLATLIDNDASWPGTGSVPS